MSKRINRIDRRLSKRFSGHLDVEIENLGSMTPNLSISIPGEKTILFDYIGHVLACLATDFRHTDARTSKADWRIVHFSRRHRKLTVRQIAYWKWDGYEDYYRVLGEDSGWAHIGEDDEDPDAQAEFFPIIINGNLGGGQSMFLNLTLLIRKPPEDEC